MMHIKRVLKDFELSESKIYTAVIENGVKEEQILDLLYSSVGSLTNSIKIANLK